MLKDLIETNLKQVRDFYSTSLTTDYIERTLVGRVQQYFVDSYSSYFETLDTLSDSHIFNLATRLKPWAKGPFDLGDFQIDAEWDCDQKWKRVLPFLPECSDKTMLDIGSGNGYYLFQMEKLNPKWVLGLDPTFHYFCQYNFLQKLYQKERVALLPLSLQEFSNESVTADVVCCFGVLYHDPAPLPFLKQCRQFVKRKGVFILETLVYPGDEPVAFVPSTHYAGMRNVYFLPTVSCLILWLEQAGFIIESVSDVNVTTSEEQRVTEWSRDVSLSNFLDNDNPKMTKEGYSRPQRVIIKSVRK